MSVVHIARMGMNVPVIDYTVTLSDQSPNAVNAGNGACSAGIRVQADGDYQTGVNFSGSTPVYSNVGGSPHEWADPDNIGRPGNTHEARMTYDSGIHLDTGVEDTWEAIPEAGLFYEMNVSVGPRTVTFNGTLEIRKVGGSALDSAAIVITANSFMV